MRMLAAGSKLQSLAVESGISRAFPTIPAISLACSSSLPPQHRLENPPPSESFPMGFIFSGVLFQIKLCGFIFQL